MHQSIVLNLRVNFHVDTQWTSLEVSTHTIDWEVDPSPTVCHFRKLLDSPPELGAEDRVRGLLAEALKAWSKACDAACPF